MSGVTKVILAEQVLYRYYGGYIDTNGPIQKDDVYKAVEQKINSLFKLHYLDTTLPSGETFPESAMIATYENRPVISLNEVSYSLLPVRPISMPKNIGIFSVYDPAYPDVNFIPLQRGFVSLLRTDGLLNDVLGQIAFEPKNDRIIYNKDLTTLGITVVTMELCIMDMSQYGINDILPVPSDYEQRIVDELVAAFMPVQPEAGVVNPFTTAGQKSEQSTKPVKI